MKLFNGTNKWRAWWKKRKIDWNQHYMTPNHPHRHLITEVLKTLAWGCLIEVGVGAGANLVNILKSIPNRQVGGIDINEDAIDACSKTFTHGIFKVCSGDDMMFSDKAANIILTDMMLIYVTPFKIKKYLREFKRVATNYVVLCELHSDKWYERLAIKWKDGYNVYDYRKLLEKNGYYDINLYKMPKNFWPESDLQQKYCTIIVARVPKNYQ